MPWEDRTKQAFEMIEQGVRNLDIVPIPYLQDDSWCKEFIDIIYLKSQNRGILLFYGLTN